MSSQGPAVTGSVSVKGFAADPAAGTPVSAGYAFDKDSIRDAGDWIAYKKQLLIANEDKTKITAEPWTRWGNDFRLQSLLGKFKRGGAGGSCATCKADAFASGSA